MVLANEPDMSTESSQPKARGSFSKLSILMPVYNERWTLQEIVRRVFQAELPIDVELIAVDDGSTDGSWEILQEVARQDRRILALRHNRNRGKGAAVRTAIDHMTGDVAVVQDADWEYDPRELRLLLQPILEGKADAVFGSRFVGHPRRVLFFWHSLLNQMLTLMSNMLNDLNLTDMETCYKMVRADVLKQLRLSSDSFTIEPELTCRLSQWGARIYEIPISYSGRTYQDGKKIRAIDGLLALWEMVRCKFLDTRFTNHSGFYILLSVSRATRYNRWILDLVKPYLGQRLLEAGSGTGNLSNLILNRQRVVLTDVEEMYVAALLRRYGWRSNVRIDHSDLTSAEQFEVWQEEELDTVFCSNVLEHLENDVDVLRSFHDTLVPGGHCIIVVPAGPWLYSPLDEELGHFRRYTLDELKQKMSDAGFETVLAKQFSRMGALGWAISARLLRRRHLSPRQMIWFDRFVPLAKLCEYCLPIPGMSLIVVGRKN